MESNVFGAFFFVPKTSSKDGLLTICRTFAEAKEMKGEWLEDPRFKGSLYFVCEQKKDGKDDGGKKEKKKGGGMKVGKGE